MQWIQTAPKEQAFWELGLFGNQNTICQPTTPKWQFTVERLKGKVSRFRQGFERSSREDLVHYPAWQCDKFRQHGPMPRVGHPSSLADVAGITVRYFEGSRDEGAAQID
jgi:hypothetical protein